MAGTANWRPRWSRRGALAVGGAAAFLAACGGGDTKDQAGKATSAPASSSGGSAAQATAPASLPAAGAGGSIRLHDNGDPVSFDYIKTWSYRSMQYTSMTYPRLLKFETKPGVGPIDFLITSDLAQKLPEQPDPTTYVFKLRPAKWENKAPLNGRALTADDVVKNWQRFTAEHPSRALLTSDVDKVEAVAPDTVKFTLRAPLGPFVNHIGHQGVFYIQPPELLSGGGLEKDMWSAGPYLFKGYEVGSRVTFERNPAYFLPDRPLLKQVSYELIPDASTTQSALRSKQLDSLAWAVAVTPNDVAAMKKDIPDATFLAHPRQGNGWFGMDLADPRFADKRVRQAISMALNRDEQVKVYGEAIWCLPWGGLTQFYWDPKKNEFANAKNYQYNLSEAKKLLDAAGVKDLGASDMLASAVWSPAQIQHAQLVQQQLKGIGLNTNIKQLEFAQFYAQTVIGGKWEKAVVVGANLVGADPNEYLSIFWTPDSPRLIAPGLKDLLAKDTELLNLIEGQKRELDAAKRKSIMKNVTDVMADRMYNIPLVNEVSYHVHRANVKNMNWIFTYGMGGEYLLDAYVQA